MPAPLERLIANHKWFHAIDFGGGLVSPGRFGPETPPNYTLYGVFEWLRGLSLDGARVLDLGTMDGLVAFIAKTMGAREVVACDLARRETFEAGRAKLGLDIEYRVPVLATDLPALFPERADVIVLSGILYHVLDPMAVMVACRRAIKRDGFAIVETMYLFDEGDARMSFSPSDTTARGSEHANVFWRPSRLALAGMLELAGFEVLGSIAVDGRISMLGRARRPSEISSRPRVQNIHRSYMNYRNYKEAIDFDALERDDGPASTVEYRGPTGDRRLYPALHRPQVPFQPVWNPTSKRAQYRHAARSAWFHGKALLAGAVADLRRAR